MGLNKKLGRKGKERRRKKNCPWGNCPESKYRVLAIAVNPATAEGRVKGCGGFDDVGFGDDGGGGVRLAKGEDSGE